jgi:hypothetical protein
MPIVLPLVFIFLKQKAGNIAHIRLRNFALNIIQDAEDFATLMLENDLTDPTIAAQVFEQQQAFTVSAMPTMPALVRQARSSKKTLK